MVIKVPIAGCENSKRWSGASGGTDRQAAKSSRTARRGKSRRPKTETRRKADDPKLEAGRRSNIAQ
jgi:hypothetical protein